MFQLAFVAASMITLPANGAYAQAIAGNWRTQSGETARIAKCGAAYCITLRSGKHKGRTIGRMRGSGSSYSGSITDPNNNKTYNGKASVSGSSMSLSGCVLGGLFCRSQTWTKR
ncbi:MAG: DUF2147 domain-containing protein [Beijerinckiaceae bacterium]